MSTPNRAGSAAEASRPGRVLVVGEALVDVIRRPGTPDAEHVGGSPANVATGLARLGHDVDFVTCLGDDRHGDDVRVHLAAMGVRLTAASSSPGRTSTATAVIGPDGAASYEFDLRWEPGSAAPGAEHGHVHTGSLATVVAPGDQTVLTGLQAARSADTTVSFDPNVRPSISTDVAAARARVEEVVALADVVKASDEDIAVLYGDAIGQDEVIDRWLELGAALVVVTLGPDGVRWRTSADRGVTPHLPPAASTVVDTVGAGDSLMAGLVSGLLDAHLLGRGARARLSHATAEDVRPAIARGLATSGVTVGHAGAWSPTRDEL